MKKNIIIGLSLGLSLLTLSIPLMAEDSMDSTNKESPVSQLDGWDQTLKDYEIATNEYRSQSVDSVKSIEISYTLYRDAEVFMENEHTLNAPFAVLETRNRVGNVTEKEGETLLEAETLTNGLLFYQDKNKIMVNIYDDKGMIHQTEFKNDNSKEQSRLLDNYKIVLNVK
jgi:hypothetical protein